MIVIRCLFWNINKKNLVYALIELIIEKDINIVIIAESENLDKSYMLDKLNNAGKIFVQKEILPQNDGLTLFANIDLSVITYKEEMHYNAYKIKENEKYYLLFTTHFSSALFASESARSHRAYDLCRTFRKLELYCNEESELMGEGIYNSIVVGDFNLQPFSDGIIGMHGFNAVMDANRAKKNSRILQGNVVPFYYNPMWSLMGKRGEALGTYYCENDQDDKSFYWYTFDQVLLKPDIIDDFVWNEFEIIQRIGDNELIYNHKIDNRRYSDHLPIKFEIR